ncbi:MAG: hypothetical protein K8S56_06865 [Candidatus Cloacimonetes bacterium]|nr:hypothetical protein [Candidatus Cloacimonadota bacterium]
MELTNNTCVYPYNFKAQMYWLESNTVFVAMPFGKKDADGKDDKEFRKSCDNIFVNLIEKAVTKANELIDSFNGEKGKNPEKSKLCPLRADSDFRTKHIWKDILEKMQSSRLFITVMMEANANVFYEMGIAHATQQIDRHIILKEKKYKVPFDINNLTHLEFDIKHLDRSVNELARIIANQIKIYKIESDDLIKNAIKSLSYYSLQYIFVGPLQSHKSKIPFEVPLWENEAVKELSQLGLMILSYKRDVVKNSIEYSYYWTLLGINVLSRLKLIKDEKAKEWIEKYRNYEKNGAFLCVKTSENP